MCSCIWPSAICHLPSVRADHLLKDHLSNLLERQGGGQAGGAAAKGGAAPAPAGAPLSVERVEEVRHLLATLDELGAKELGAKLKEFDVRAPDTKNELSDPFPFNLMFATAIGPTGLLQG